MSVLPDTSKLAPKIKEAFRSADKDVSEAARRWKNDIERELRDVKVKVDADTAAARAEIKTLDGQEVTVKVKADSSGLPPILGGGGSGGGGGGGAFKLNAGLVGIGLLPAAATAITNVAGALQQLAGAGAVVPGVFAGLASSIGVAKLSTQGLSDAFDAVTKASDGTQKSVDAANKALAELSPNAADAVKTVAGLKGTFTELRNIGSQNLFAGVSQGLMGLAGNLLPAATRGIDGISRALNQNLLQAMTSLGSGSSQGFLERIFGNTAGAQSKLTAAIDPIIHAFGTLAAAGSDSLPRLADAVGKVAERFNNFITAADGDGRLQKWIGDGLTGFTNLGNIVLNIGKSFTAITQAAGGGAGLLSTLQSATASMSTFLNSTEGQNKLKNFFETGRQQLGQLRDIAVQLAPVLGGVFQAGLNATNLWLPVIKQVLDILNRIPGGAEGVVTAFVAWKTIQGPVQLLNSITNISNALGGLGGKATGAVGLMNKAFAAVVIPAGLLEALHFQQENARADDNAQGKTASAPIGPRGMDVGVKPKPAPTGPDGVNRTPLWKQWFGDDKNNQYTGGGGSFGPTPGSISSDTLSRKDDVSGVPDPLPAPVPIPALSTYTPPVVTEAPKTSGTPNLPYTGTADPYAAQSGMYSGSSGYPGDAALLASVPAGIYTQGQRGDLTKGLADCSSAVEDLVNIMDGRSTAGATMSTANEAQFLASRGFVQGMGGPGDFRVGFNSGHTQATLPGGTNFNWGSQAAAASGGIAPNSGADDPAFTSHWYRPAGGMGSSMYGGDMSGGATGLTSQDMSLRNAQQRIDDTQHTQEQAEGRLNELRAKGTATDRQMEAAEYAVAKAKREHQDAIDGLTVAQDKYNKSSAKGQGGSTDGSSLGGDIFGGLLEATGLDGSLFKNPFQSGMWKGITGVANFAGALGQAKNEQMNGGAGAGGGGGGDLFSGLLGIAQGLMPGMPNGNSANIVGAAQFKPPGGPDSPGPGNGPTINLQGASFGDSHHELSDQIAGVTASMPRWPALAQNLPQP